jgi:hypothetical protein
MNEAVVPYLDKFPTESQTVFLRKLAEQLVKDLQPLEWAEIPDSPSPTWIQAQLQLRIEELIAHQSTRLGNILYRIDLPEGKIRALIAAASTDERAEILAAQILEREARKVWMRMHYTP